MKLKLENLGKLEKKEDKLRAALKDEKIDQKTI